MSNYRFENLAKQYFHNSPMETRDTDPPPPPPRPPLPTYPYLINPEPTSSQLVQHFA